jgi:N-acetylglutamate synthase-like GNAT family acetyltransferase
VNGVLTDMITKKRGDSKIIYKFDVVPTAQQVIELYDEAGLPRPTHDPKRITAMFDNSNLIVTAWAENKLVGVSRTITDWVWCSYLADLAVSPEYKRSGIGKKLIELSREKIGDQSMLLLLSVPTAMDYYPKVGFVREERAFITHRTK